MNTKKISILTVAVAACSILLAACATTAAKADFTTDVNGKVWQLSQVLNSAGKATYSHAALGQDEFFKDIYTLQFDKERVNGKAAPNRYNGPFTLGENNAIAFKHFASTMMMGIKVPNGLSEHQYFQLMEKANKWEVKKGQLKLSTVDANGAKATMIFKEFDYR
ncbi:heat shock protein HslJ [Elusimicrobium simillimum]|uniref:META domain-containing protein n=1 Tax=Elusimicrobium simillimum TaxID=3143438 RepID=UPI003C6FEB05